MRRGVLVVEEEAIVAEATREALCALGYPVSGVVHSGEDAVRHALELGSVVAIPFVFFAAKVR